MPRYSYECEECQQLTTVFHLMSEVLAKCPKCESENIEKVLSTPIIMKKRSDASISIGQLTKEYILANKEILEEEKEKAKEETYEPT